jgi:hypothetical protein
MKLKEFFKGIKKGQKEFGEDIAQVINFILLTIVYFIGVGLTSIFAKIVGKSFLDLNIDKNVESYWEELNLEKDDIREYYRQF